MLSAKVGVRSGDNGGFSLVEMMVVVSLLTISLIIMMPPIYRERQRARNEASVAEFLASHDLARQLAMRYGRTAEFQIDDNKDVWEVEVDTTFDGHSPITIRTGIFKGQLTADRKVVCFDGRGLPTTRGKCEEPDMTVSFTRGDWSKTVRFSPVGSPEQ